MTRLPSRPDPRPPIDSEWDFRARVYAWIARIPPGRVATYGQIARLAGAPRRARHVGQALAHAPAGLSIPWHRVVNAQGRISPRRTMRPAQPARNTGSPSDPDAATPAERRQMRRLQREGVRFRNGRIDLARFGWRPEEDGLG